MRWGSTASAMITPKVVVHVWISFHVGWPIIQNILKNRYERTSIPWREFLYLYWLIDDDDSSSLFFSSKHMREQRSIFSFLFFFPELEEPNHDDKLVGGAGKISILLIKINKFDVEVYGKLLGKNKLYTEYMCIGIRQEKHFNDLSAAGNFFFVVWLAASKSILFLCDVVRNLGIAFCYTASSSMKKKSYF